MEQISAPNGIFELRNLINAAACPQCGEFVNKMWYYIPDISPDDKFKIGTGIVMSCEACAKEENGTYSS